MPREEIDSRGNTSTLISPSSPPTETPMETGVQGNDHPTTVVDERERNVLFSEIDRHVMNMVYDIFIWQGSVSIFPFSKILDLLKRRESLENNNNSKKKKKTSGSKKSNDSGEYNSPQLRSDEENICIKEIHQLMGKCSQHSHQQPIADHYRISYKFRPRDQIAHGALLKDKITEDSVNLVVALSIYLILKYNYKKDDDDDNDDDDNVESNNKKLLFDSLIKYSSSSSSSSSTSLSTPSTSSDSTSSMMMKINIKDYLKRSIKFVQHYIPFFHPQIFLYHRIHNVQLFYEYIYDKVFNDVPVPITKESKMIQTMSVEGNVENTSVTEDNPEEPTPKEESSSSPSNDNIDKKNDKKKSKHQEQVKNLEKQLKYMNELGSEIDELLKNKFNYVSYFKFTEWNMNHSYKHLFPSLPTANTYVVPVHRPDDVSKIDYTCIQKKITSELCLNSNIMTISNIDNMVAYIELFICEISTNLR
eukprot:TRINITY_DN2182_c1_g1_i5.p1 TRINITY_DN2182_c1_g1~~TRINITY_DN2182_c1_g1_i5.p1  ORF type:complete len:475 (-),score=138.49 TRINITY_DN2182_c1_g1_i5:219-1643(-)